MGQGYHRSEITRRPQTSASALRAFPPEMQLPNRSRDTVYLVDDDYRVREGVSEFLESRGVRVRSFASAQQYLDANKQDDASCLVLDFQLPDVSGLDLQRQLAGKASPPIIFISGQADVPISVHAIKAGAIEFLTKPVDPEILLRCIQMAFERDKKYRQRLAENSLLLKRYSQLTPREQEVLPLVIGGLLNKQAAAFLGISEVTLQIHRRQVMRKMEADSLPDLVRMAMKLRIQEWPVNSSSDWNTRQPPAALAS